MYVSINIKYAIMVNNFANYFFYQKNNIIKGMKNKCMIVDLSDNEAIQEIELKENTNIYEWIDSIKYGSLIIFPSSVSCDKAVIMCPGGGLTKINMQHEGYDFAPWFNKQHITYAILKYHLPADDKFATLNDASLGIQAIRQMYPEINSIGVMGASIGGYLAAHAAIFGSEETKVDFQILLYPVVNMQNEWVHLLSRERLFGKDLSDTEQIERSLEYQINQSTPPAFMVAATDDPVVSPINSIRYCEYLISNNIPISFHLYPLGGHSFGFNDFMFKTEWLTELSKWLQTF